MNEWKLFIFFLFKVIRLEWLVPISKYAIITDISNQRIQFSKFKLLKNYSCYSVGYEPFLAYFITFSA